jgi:hypothetical protein
MSAQRAKVGLADLRLAPGVWPRFELSTSTAVCCCLVLATSRPWIVRAGIAAYALALPTLCAGCSENAERPCVDGSSRRCDSESGCAGIAVCQDGRWSACDCDGEAASAPRGGNALPSRLGEACDGQCAGDALCVLGFCSTACETDADCTGSASVGACSLRIEGSRLSIMEAGGGNHCGVYCDAERRCPSGLSCQAPFERCTGGSPLATEAINPATADCREFPIGPDACSQCLASQCCTEVLTCDISSECLNLEVCQSQCQSDACIERCRQDNTAGALIFDSALDCVLNQCGADCT